MNDCPKDKEEIDLRIARFLSENGMTLVDIGITLHKIRTGSTLGDAITYTYSLEDVKDL